MPERLLDDDPLPARSVFFTEQPGAMQLLDHSAKLAGRDGEIKEQVPPQRFAAKGGKLPFEPLVPNETTIAAMREARAGNLKAFDSVEALMADKKLLIADGHHRYETALGFRDQNPGLEGADRVVMTFVNMHSPGLRILATHRLVNNLAMAGSPDEFLRAAEGEFRGFTRGSFIKAGAAFSALPFIGAVTPAFATGTEEADWIAKDVARRIRDGARARDVAVLPPKLPVTTMASPDRAPPRHSGPRGPVCPSAVMLITRGPSQLLVSPPAIAKS